MLDPESEDAGHAPPFVRNETILFARMGYHRYIKVNANLETNLDLRQQGDRWYKFDFLFTWEDYEVTVFIDD